MAQQTIDKTNGNINYTRRVVFFDLEGNDITGEQLMLSLGSESAPGQAVVPDLTSIGSILARDFAQRYPSVKLDPDKVNDLTPLYFIRGQLLVGAVGATIAPALGAYRLWKHIAPGVEEIVAPTPLQVIVV